MSIFLPHIDFNRNLPAYLFDTFGREIKKIINFIPVDNFG